MSFRSLLRQRAEVIRPRPHPTVDTFGQASAPSAIVVFDDIPCRLSQPILRTGAGNAERQDDSHRMMERTFVCYMDRRVLDGNRSKIKSKDRLVIDGATYEVEKIMPRSRHTQTHHLEVAVQEIVREEEEDI